MNVSKNLLVIMFTGFMLVQTQAQAQQPTAAARGTAKPATQASTPPAQAPTAAPASQPTINVNPANAASPASQQDVSNITFGLREVRGLQNTLNALPANIHKEILAKMAAAKEPLTINQVRALINSYLRGTPATSGQPATKAGAASAAKAAAPNAPAKNQPK